MHRYTYSFLCLLLVGSPLFAQDMPLSQILIDGENWQLVSEGHSFSDGPTCDAAGNVFFVDGPKSQIFKIDVTTGNVIVWAEDVGNISGLKFGGDGRLYGCQGGKKRIVAFAITADGKPGEQSTIAEPAEPNDLIVTRNNEVYWTDFNGKQVWYVDAAGKKRVVDTGIERPNGITLWADQKTLVVAEFGGASAWTFRIGEDGGLSFKEPYYPLRLVPNAKESKADGMTVDSAGRLYVATEAGLQVFDPTGRMSGVLMKPQRKFLSNVCFGGEKFDTLYVTCQDKVYSRRVKAEGVRHFLPEKK